MSLHAPLAFLPAASHPDRVFLPEDVTEDDRLIAEVVGEFMDREVLPSTPALEQGDIDTLLALFARAAEVGLTGITVPERFGGPGASITGTMLAAAELGRQESFATAVGAHLGIGSMALVLFGSEELKERYLPQLASAERIGAYALTEPGAGSDALNISTRARPDGEGGWRLTGEKQFITNAGIAGLYTVFAKVEGEGFTAFVLPAEGEGVSAGLPEKKMGLRGSLTASLSMDEAPVPPGHVLGELGKGHRVAFNILNLGRTKLGFGSLGAAREATAEAARYASERCQFGKPIGELGLIREKLAGMAGRVFLLEGACLRVAGSLDAALPEGLDAADPARVRKVLEAHSVPSAMLKVLGSELLCEVVDEAVQVHGGYGFIEDYPVCRMYRDVRVNRIFEGTNEVNRLLVAGGVFKGGLKGAFDMDALLALGKGPAPGGTPGLDALCADLRWVLSRLATAGMQRFGMTLRHEQVVMAAIGDLAIELFALDTAAARLARGPSGPLGGELGQALAALVTETARSRLLGLLVPLASRLDPEAKDELVAPLVAGASDVSDARETVVAAVLEAGGIPW